MPFHVPRPSPQLLPPPRTSTSLRSASRLVAGAAIATALLGCTSNTSSSNPGAGSDAGAGDSGGPGSNVPGDTTSVWQATTAEISSVDTSNPSGFKQDTVPLPAKAVDGATGRTAELYRKLEGDKLVTFAHYDGDDVYYRITQTCLMSENTCTVFWDEVSMQFTSKDGTFEEVTQHLVDKTQVVSVTTKFSAVPFPPAGWPTRVVAHDLGARQ